MKTRTSACAAVILGLLLVGGPSSLGQSADPPKKGAKSPMPDLVAGLKATPGCLGVETARTASGKDVIFAWFEDKKAVLKWYYSEMHREAMKDFFPAEKYSKPLAHIADDSGPIMVVASITPAAKPALKETPLSISQIAIELYQPLPGGASVGGRFSPRTLKVPHLRDYTGNDK